ncbi:hypothetical protein FJZ36_13445 [Candidatus Poribacteria bacterium]|nr:hypothetical protein [Candidatus Poribacteria bacterium]
MQTGREAVDAMLRHLPADHIPIHDSPWGDTVRKWAKQGMPTDANGNPVSAVEHFGFDLVGCGGWFDWLPKRGVHEVLEETDEWRIVRNGAGAALKWWKHKSGTPEHIDFLMTDRDVWERDYRPLVAEIDPSRFGDAAAVAKNLETWRAKGRWAHFGTQFIWENMRGSMGDYTMYTALLTDPEWIHDFNRVYTDLYIAGFRHLFENAGLPDGVWLYEDLGYRDRLFCSPKVLDEVIFPYYREMVDFFHSYDLPVVLHSCGYQAAALPLIVDAGFDGLNPMEVKAGNDIFAFAESYGDRIAFVGGLDARILESGNRDVIRAGVTGFIRGMKARGARFVYGSDHSLSTNIDYDDFQYSLEVYRSEYTL